MFLNPDTIPVLVFIALLAGGITPFYRFGRNIGRRVSIRMWARINFRKRVKEVGFVQAVHELDRRIEQLQLEAQKLKQK